MSKYFGITPKSAWKMLDAIRTLCASLASNDMFGGDGLEVEIDETFIKTFRGGQGAKRKTISIFGISDRDRVWTTRVSSRKRVDLLPIIQRKVLPGTIIHTDGWSAYNTLGLLGYHHRRVNHSVGIFVASDGARTTSIDSYWSFMKRIFYGTYRNVKYENIDKYLKEAEVRYEYRRRANKFIHTMILLACSSQIDEGMPSDRGIARYEVPKQLS